jgi:hypothetical protein
MSSRFSSGKKSRKEVWRPPLFLFPTREDWWVRTDEESGPKRWRWRPPAALFVPPTRQSSAVATAARAAAQKKKVLDERERPGTRMHAWGSFLLSAFAPTRRYHHIYVLTVVAYRRLQFKQCRTSSIRGHPSHVRTYVQYILVCCCEKKHNRCISCGWSHVS